MESKQLAFFLLACQQQKHAAAARELGVAPSTLSATLNDLEAELGFKLFLSSASGHHPTLEARTIYQSVDNAIRFLTAMAGSGVVHRRSILQARFGLWFALGRLSKAASLAALRLQLRDPSVYWEVSFEDAPASRMLRPLTSDGASAPSDLVIDYCSDEPAEGDVPVAKDPWVAVFNTSMQLESATPAALQAAAERMKICIPDLPPRLVRDALAYCEQHGLPAPEAMGDAGAMVQFAMSDEPRCLLMPRSLLSARLAQHRLVVVPLHVPLESTIVARLGDGGDASVRAFATELRAALEGPETNVAYKPLITLRQLRYFNALLEQRSVSGAARRLNVTQPAISTQLTKLEATLGAPLFERGPKGLSLPRDVEQASQLLDLANARFNEITRLCQHLRMARREVLAVGIVPVAERNGVLVQAMSAAIRTWLAAGGNRSIEVLEAPSSVLHEWIRAARVGIAIVEEAEPQMSRLSLQCRDRLGLVTSARTRSEAAASLEQMQGMPLLLVSRRFGLRRMVDRAAQAHGWSLTVEGEIDSLPLLLAMVKDGSQATILPQETVKEFVQRNELRFTPLVKPEISRELSVIYSSEHPLTAATREFVAVLRNNLKKRFAADADQEAREADAPPDARSQNATRRRTAVTS